MAGRTNTPGLKSGGDDPSRVALTVNLMLLGALNNTFDLTLTPSAASTTYLDSRIGQKSMFVFDPRTAHAKAEHVGTSMYVASVSKGSVTIAHSNSAQTDRDFVVGILGQ